MGCQCCSPEREVTPEEEDVHLAFLGILRKGRKEGNCLLCFHLVEVSRSGTVNRNGSGFGMHSRELRWPARKGPEGGGRSSRLRVSAAEAEEGFPPLLGVSTTVCA